MYKPAILHRLAAVLDPTLSFGPVSYENIEAAERALGVTFPVSYRAFLQVYGASLGVAGYGLAGLFDPPPPDETPRWNNVVVDTIRHRKALRGHHPLALVTISSDRCEDTYCIDTNISDTEGESPVVVIGPGRDYERVASSFVEFVEKTASAATI